MTNKKWIKKTIFVILVIFVLCLIQFIGSNAIQNSVHWFSQPIYQVFDGWGRKTDKFLNYFREKESLKRERDILLIQRNDLLKKLISQNQCLVEKEALIEISGIKERIHDWQIIKGSLSYFDPSQDWGIINLGKEDDVQVGQSVITSDYIFIGKIVETSDRQSRIIFLSHPDFWVKVRTLDDSPARGFLRGRGNMIVELESIDLAQPFREGQNLITELFRDEYPAGLLVGQMGSIEKDDVRSSLKAKIFPLINFLELDIIFVIQDF
jgi:rod shape-determining protein MreC